MTDHLSDAPSSATDYVTLTHANEEAVLASERAGSMTVDGRPMKITFEFTGDCNLHCFFCDCEFHRNEFRARGVKKFAMDEDTFRRLAEAAFPKATVVNPTVVGEPFTFPYFDLMLEYAEKYDTKLEIITNGMLLKGPMVRRLMPLLDRLTISFDGGTKETFEKCRTGSKFETVIENLRHFRDLRRELGLERQVKFGFGVALMRENIEEFSRIVEWAHELDADEVTSTHLLVFTKTLRGSSLFEHKTLSNRCIADAVETAERLGVPLTAPGAFDLDATDDEEDEATAKTPESVNSIPSNANANDEPNDDAAASIPARFDAVAPPPPRTDRPQPIALAHENEGPAWSNERFWCKFAWRETFVAINGDVAPCCHQGRPVVGNVFETDFDEMWNGAVYRGIRKGLYDKMPTPFCGSCSLLQEQGYVDYDEKGYMFDDRYPDQTTADLRHDGKPRPKRK